MANVGLLRQCRHVPKALLVLNTLTTEQYNSNVHRGVHTRAKATDAYEARDKVGAFKNQPRGSVFTRNATEAISSCLQLGHETTGDEIILSVMEHHSNLIPWQLLAQRTGAVLKFVELLRLKNLTWNTSTDLRPDEMVSTVHVSNTLGCINPVQEIVRPIWSQSINRRLPKRTPHAYRRAEDGL